MVQSLPMMSCSQKTIRPFRLSYPLTLRTAAAEKAKASGLSLHDYILVAIKEKIQR
jgi:predicted HicB family RNase H-like nuclease